MMYQQIRGLEESGVTQNEILYVSFEDELLLEVTADDLNVILEVGLEMAGDGKKPYIFLNEIQFPYSFHEYLHKDFCVSVIPAWKWLLQKNEPFPGS